MAFDVYAPCPCGSQKKLKFCCAAVADDMERILRLHENGQSHVALQQLEALSRRSMGPEPTAWVTNTRVLILLQLQELLAARALLEDFLKRYPDNEQALVLYAMTLLGEGIDAARPAIARAFQKAFKKQPLLASNLALSVATTHLANHSYLAAHSYLGLAMRLAPEAGRQDVFMRLLRFESDHTIPFPLRGPHRLPELTSSDEEVMKEVRKAQKYAQVGCWGIAAEILEKLIGRFEQAAPVWHAAGLCYAFDGQSSSAMACLRQAGQLYGTTSDAVDCEVLAQLIELEDDNQQPMTDVRQFRVDSSAALIAALEAHPRFTRSASPQRTPGEPEVIYFTQLDRDRLPNDPRAVPALGDIPRAIGNVILFDVSEGEQSHALAMVVPFAPATGDDVEQLFREAYQGPVSTPDETLPPVHRSPDAVHFLRTRLVFHDKTPAALRTRMICQEFHESIVTQWPDRPLASLGGRTPREAAADPSSYRAVMAALIVTEALADSQSLEFPVDRFRSEFGLAALPPTQLAADEGINSLSTMQLHRLDLASLSDAQLLSAANRAQLLVVTSFMYPCLLAALDRPECKHALDLRRVYMLLTEVCRERGDRDGALRWLQEERQLAEASEQRFEAVWKAEMRELNVRMDDPFHAETLPFVERFLAYYSPKLPQLRAYVEDMLASAGLELPRLVGSDLFSANGLQRTSAAVWTPDEPVGAGAAPASAPSGGSKLWLPGQ